MEAVSEITPGQRLKSKAMLWQERIEVWQASGESQRAWCEREGVPLSSMRYWRKKLSGCSVPAVVPSSTSRLIPVSLARATTALTINAGGVSIEVAADVDRDLLKAVLRILQQP